MLTDAEKEHFITQGFLLVRDERGVEAMKVENCLRGINHALGKPHALSGGGAQKNMGKLDGSFSQSLTRELMSGCGSAHWVIEAFAREGQEAAEADKHSAQIALRFPERPDSLYELLCTADLVGKGAAWHTDGLRKGKQHPFSLLLGVALSDIQEEYKGNLLVWPGKHKLVHSCLTPDNKHGFDVGKLRKMLGEEQSIEEVEEEGHNNVPDLPHLGKPHSVLLKKGDLVLLHPDLPHSGGPNWGADIRVMVYFRLTFCLQLGENRHAEEHRRDMLHNFHSSFREIRDGLQGA